MKLCRALRRTKPDVSKLPLTFNLLLAALGLFIVLAMCIVWFLFEEYTAFTDYTQQWIEFNYFISYWDKLTITRVYLAFIHIYGGTLLAISTFQLYGLRKRNINILYLAPYLLFIFGVVSMLGAIAWLITTAVNHNEGFLATGGFIFERMRFKGNVWKDLKFREQSFRVVTDNMVPPKAPILKTWIYQRQRDFDCCGWNSYLDYANGNWSQLPESCCARKYRTFGCGADYANSERAYMFNVRGCKDVMYDWYRSGFTMNIIMALIGILISAFEFVTYTYNRKAYFSLLYELDDMSRPMMNTMSMSTINSKSSAPYGFNGGSVRGGGAGGSMARGGPSLVSGGSIRSSNSTLIAQSQISNQLPRLAMSTSMNSYGPINKGSIYEQPYTIRK